MPGRSQLDLPQARVQLAKAAKMEPSVSAPIAAIEALALEPAIDRLASELWAVVFAHLATTPAFGEPLTKLEVALGAGPNRRRSAVDSTPN